MKVEKIKMLKVMRKEKKSLSLNLLSPVFEVKRQKKVLNKLSTK